MTVVETTSALQRGTEHLVRSAPKGGLRAITIGGNPGIQLQILRYNVVDSYGSVWLPGCLNKSLRSRPPQIVWSHVWADMIGRMLPENGWRDTADGPVVDFYLDDFDAVPRAKQAYAQVKSGTVDDCSIGFDLHYLWRSPTKEELQLWPGAREMIEEADLDEVSLVLRGAVPGAKVVNFRQRGQRSRLLGLRSAQVIDAELAARIMTQFAADVERGEADLFSALQQVKEAAVAAPIVESNDNDKESKNASTEIEEQEDSAKTDELSDELQEPETTTEILGLPEGGLTTEESEVDDKEKVALTEETDVSQKVEPDPELDQTLAEIDNLLAERESA